MNRRPPHFPSPAGMPEPEEQGRTGAEDLAAEYWSAAGGQEESPAVDSAPPGEAEPAAALDEADLAALCRERICPGCPEKKEADDARLRVLAELDNARKRLAREREEQIRFASEAVLTEILPSLDNLNLALFHAAPDDACRDFVVGVRMTRDLLTEALKKHGLLPVGEVGEAFDPSRHEAVGMAPADDVPEGHVCALLASGYTLHGRLLRPAKVMVCRRT